MAYKCVHRCKIVMDWYPSSTKYLMDIKGYVLFTTGPCVNFVPVEPILLIYIWQIYGNVCGCEMVIILNPISLKCNGLDVNW